MLICLLHDKIINNTCGVIEISMLWGRISCVL